MTEISQPHPCVSKTMKTLLYVLGVIFPILAAYYLHVWLAGNVPLGYFGLRDVVVCKGQAEVERDVTLVVDKVYYKTQSFDKLRIVRFLISNRGTRSLAKGAEFCFVAKEPTIIPVSAVVAVTTKPIEDCDSVILSEQKFFDGVGPGFIFRSAFPGEAKLEVQLVLDVGISQKLENVAIEMKQVASLQPSTLRKLGETTLTFTLSNFVIWIVLSAAIYGAVWLLINIATGNYSSGARIANWIWKAAFAKGFIPEVEADKPGHIENHDDGDRASRLPDEPPAPSK